MQRLKYLPAALLCLLPAATMAEFISADLNRDGRPERFLLIDGPYGQILQIENTGGGVIDIEGLVPAGVAAELGFDWQDRLTLALFPDLDDGHARQFALWIGFLDGDYRIGGITYRVRHQTDGSHVGICTIDLSEGRVEIGSGGAQPRRLRILPAAPPLDADYLAQLGIPPSLCEPLP